MFFRSVHAVAKGKSFLLFNFWVVFHCVDIPWLFYPLIVYHSECEVLTSSVFLRNPQKLMYPFKALITLVIILNVKAETSTLRFVKIWPVSKFSLETSAEKNKEQPEKFHLSIFSFRGSSFLTTNPHLCTHYAPWVSLLVAESIQPLRPPGSAGFLFLSDFLFY